MEKHRAAVVALAFVAAMMIGAVSPAHAQTGPATAIDVALEPDAVMMARAQAANADLLKDFPKGFALDATHNPHITLLQRYARTADLNKVYAAVAKVLARENVTRCKLKATRYYYASAGPVGVAGIVVDTTPDLLRLQKELIDAVAPFTVETGDVTAFYTTPEEPTVIPAIVTYVATYVPQASGDNFNGHVTTGIGTIPFLKALVAAPFDAFTFTPAGVSIWQLGDYGTARKELRALDQRP